MVKNYSLADYDITIRSVALDGQNLTDNFNFTLGGAGSFLGSVKIQFDGEIWKKETDVLGNVVYTKSYARDGQITISLNMLSEKVKIFNKIIQLYYGGSIKNKQETNIQDMFFSITVKRHTADPDSTTAEVEATYCVLQKLPDLEFADTAGVRDFVFLAAEIGAPNVIDSLTDSYSYRGSYNS